MSTGIDSPCWLNARHADAHRRMYRPWGWYQRIDIGERFQVKRIQVTPGGRLSLRKHVHRAEHRVVVTGTDEVTLNDQGCSHTGEDAIVRVKDIDGR